MDRKILIALAVVVAVLVYYYFFMRKPAVAAVPVVAAVPTAGASSDLTVYGTNECGWTVKQLKYLDDNGFKYTFVNCKDGKCPSDVTGYPTMIYKGERINGYNELTK